MSKQNLQSPSFIDQVLAGQLFVAARAHDSLSEEVSNFLPPSISDVFPVQSEHSRKYKSAAYNALVKSQNNIDSHGDDSENDSVVSVVDGNVILSVLRDVLMQKTISSFLSMNDKLSLIFAVSEENQEEEKDEDLVVVDDDNDVNEVSKKDKSKGKKDEELVTEEKQDAVEKGITLTEDLFIRESEDLEMLRNQYLSQLVKTREVESSVQRLQQQLDRTECILKNQRSADILKLNFMANKLFLLRDITSKNYEDYFSARGSYASWSLEHQEQYLAKTNFALDQACSSIDQCRKRHEETVSRCQQVMSDVFLTADDQTGSFPKKKSTESPRPRGSPRRRASVIISRTEGVQLRDNNVAIEFNDMRQKGLDQLAPYQDEDISDILNSSKGSCNFSESNTQEVTNDIAELTRRRFPSFDGSESLQSDDNRQRSRTSSAAVDYGLDDLLSPTSRKRKESLSSTNHEMELYRRKVSTSLKSFEAELCEKMENMSNLTLNSIKKKYLNLELSDDLPLYLNDIKWKIEQKKQFVVAGTKRIQATKENLAEEFESKIEKSYDMLLENNLAKLRRMQSYSFVEGSR